MLLLITGASGAGKSTVRAAIADQLFPLVECAELLDLTSAPETMTKAWRQQAAELAVRRAIELQASGRHLLLAGDPVPAAEVVAADWRAHTIDTTTMTQTEVAEAALAWCHRALAGGAPTLRLAALRPADGTGR